ncbi:cytochrome c [Pandoraea anhela]|uniref:Cytochrome C n=1 Tax=Pandoraea anhela TaxID=2508295 RepID=A0A5E4RBP4_9BURK|nr:c-type cytochrome [Pandoraea anhela]VVD60700.1 cytochrome C [Pandoraea anhela]
MTRIDDASPEREHDDEPSPPLNVSAPGANPTSPEVGGPSCEPDRRASYAWPLRRGEATAQFAISAQTRDDGTLRTWCYRAELDGPMRLDDSASPSPLSRNPQHPLPPYRHERIATQVIDPAQCIPAPAHAFARESFIDEVAVQAVQDPVDYRLRHLQPGSDDGPREVIRMVAQRAAWGLPQAHAHAAPPGWQRGRGFAFDGRSASADPAAEADTWSAWIVDLDVNPTTGDIALRRVVAGQGEGRPDKVVRVGGVPAHEIATAVRQALGTSWEMTPGHDETGASDGEQPVMLRAAAVSNRPDGSDGSDGGDGSGRPAAWPASEADTLVSAAAPAAAAIANALFDATGIRLRQPPFTPEHLRTALREPTGAIHPKPSKPQRPLRDKRWSRWTSVGALGGIGAIGAIGGLAGIMLFGAAEIAPITAPDNTLWSSATLERGRQIALAGDCAVCHTAAQGSTNAGGLALETPFGTLYSTNITPDPETGIGRWSYAAFARAMREGISRDGSHLYPAFPYTAFAKMSEPDMLALYAYLMSQAPVNHTPPKTALPFPLNQRRLVAGWNWLYHDTAEYRPDPSQSTLWNRGRYLVDGAGHCGACHTPRNMLGAEQPTRYLGGGEAEGWRAPPLVASKDAPVPWTESALFDYLRTGFSPEHGVAAGPMAPVVAGLAELPETDVRAIAHYLASLSPQTQTSTVAAMAHERAKGADIATTLGLENGRRTFEAACAVCHTDSGGVGHFGVRPLMGLNTSVSQATPDNLMHVLMNGIDQPATEALGYMPGFREAFDDRQMAELAAFIRARYAPDQPAWQGLEAAAARARQAPAH